MTDFYKVFNLQCAAKVIKGESCEGSITISSYGKRLIFLEGAAEHVITWSKLMVVIPSLIIKQTPKQGPQIHLKKCNFALWYMEWEYKGNNKMLIIQEKDKNSSQFLANISLLT